MYDVSESAHRTTFVVPRLAAASGIRQARMRRHQVLIKSLYTSGCERKCSFSLSIVLVLFAFAGSGCSHFQSPTLTVCTLCTILTKNNCIATLTHTHTTELCQPCCEVCLRTGLSAKQMEIFIILVLNKNVLGVGIIFKDFCAE